MKYIIKKLFCQHLNREVKSVFYIRDIINSAGEVKMKSVEYYDCEGKKECYEKTQISNCTCFKEMKKVEQEINGFA